MATNFDDPIEKEGFVLSSLDLEPKLSLMLVQAGVFAANYLVVRHLFVAPFLALRGAREKETEGAKEEAKSFLLEGKKVEQDIDARMQAAFNSAKEIRAKAQKRAHQEYDRVVAEARKRSEEHLKQVSSEIELALKQERQKVGKESALLSSFLSSLLFPKEKA